VKLENMPLSVTDWKKLGAIGARGETGRAVSRELDQGGVRVRIVEYSANYLADHWCAKGHIVLVLEGDLTVELKDRKKYDLKGEMSLQVGDDVALHRVFSKDGARVIIFD
jgi:hypothetical protein